MKFALDELIYVLQGQGVSTVWRADDAPKKTFEWQDRSLFHVASNSTLQLGNMRGDKPVRLLRYSYLPLATSLVTDPQFFFNNPYQKAGCSPPRKAKPIPKLSWSKTAILRLPGVAVESTGTAIFSRTWRRGTSSRPTVAGV